MLIDTISASFDVSARLYNNTPGVSGAIQTRIARNLGDLGLDAIYTKVIPCEDLVLGALTWDDFPTVELNGVAVDGDDKLPLTMNSIHGVVVQILARKDGDGVDLPKAGFVTLTLTLVGSGAGTGPAYREIVAGDDYLNTTVLGWPGVTASTIKLEATVDLADCDIVFAFFGSSAGTAGGYGS